MGKKETKSDEPIIIAIDNWPYGVPESRTKKLDASVVKMKKE